MKESHLEFFKNFFSSTYTDEIEYVINNKIFYVRKNIIFGDIHNKKYPLIVLGDNIWVNFENDSMHYFKIMLPYLIKLNVDFFYLTYEIFQQYPCSFLTTTSSISYFKTIFNNIYMKDSGYNNGNTNYYDHYRYYNNKNKLNNYFIRNNFNWKDPLYRLIENQNNRHNYLDMLNSYINKDEIEYEIGEYDKFLRVNKLNDIMKWFDSDEFNDKPLAIE